MHWLEERKVLQFVEDPRRPAVGSKEQQPDSETESTVWALWAATEAPREDPTG